MSKAKRACKPLIKQKRPVNYKRLVMILTAAFLGAVLILSAVLGIVGAVKQNSYFMYCGGVGVDEGVVNYLAVARKTTYLKSLNEEYGKIHEDSESLWQSKMPGSDKTYGEDLKEDVESYLKSVIAANAVFNKYTSLTAADKTAINQAISDKLTSIVGVGGSARDFNERAVEYGFDYSSLVIGTEMLYKYKYAAVKIFGSDGENSSLVSSLYPMYQEFIEEYSRVYLVFVRDETAFVLDENGNRVKDSNGKDKLREKTAEELVRVEEALAEIRAVLPGLNSGAVAPEKYEELMLEYDEGDPEYYTDGYYFHKNSSITKEYKARFPGLVEAATALEIGQATEVQTTEGPCFIYRAGISEGAYISSIDNPTLADFFTLAGKSIYSKLVAEAAKNVEIRERWEKANPADIPYTTDFLVRF